MQNIQVTIPVNDLADAIAAKLTPKNNSNIQTGEQEAKTSFLSRIEAAKLLKISLPTLHFYTKRGLIAAYRLGRRVLYKQSDIENSPQKINTGVKL